jgi:hypothetical protein
MLRLRLGAARADVESRDQGMTLVERGIPPAVVLMPAMVLPLSGCGGLD